MTEILDEKALQLLPTKKFYDQLDNGTDGCPNANFYITVKDLLDRYNVLQVGSNKISKGLCYVYGKNFPDISDNDICNFLYYWLGEILYDNLIPRINLGSVISNLFVILRIRNEKKCTAPNYYNFNEDKYFKKIKLFFDYSKDYDIYEKQISNNNPTCNKKYYEYLQTYVETYKEFEGKCPNKSHSSGYCKAFNEYFDEKIRTNLSKLTCNLQDYKPGAEEVHDKTEATEEQPSPTHRKEGLSVTLSTGSEGERKQVEKPHGASVYPSTEGKFELNSASDLADDPPTPTITKSIVTAASAAGLLMPPFLIYNFTPVRSWINKLLGRNQIYRNPLTERELIENSYQPDNFDSERNRYNIMYRPE
ncbi:VIR protein [Plasmodium vivax]|uniref:VIR protein n=1 Tax=Plasmodium vivax TaxID=5855 RepID=A0A1G4E129_PLAVI|nr:VIR protein [Plasmodium vivax]